MTRTKAKWLNDYSQLQPNLPSSKNVCIVIHEKWKILQKKKTGKSYVFFFVQTLQSNRFVYLFEPRTPIPSKKNKKTKKQKNL